MTQDQRPLPEQLRAFNEQRRRDFGRPPRADDPLPLPPVGAGGDVAPDYHEELRADE